MRRNSVNWNSIQYRDPKSGIVEDNFFPTIIDYGYRCELLHNICSMPRKNPISFAKAVRLAVREYFSSDYGFKKGQSYWYLDNFVDWISDLGFHIELSGEEFDSHWDVNS
jgi:hypothetical protein